VHTPKRSNRPTVQPKTQASIDDQHSEAILGKLGEKSRLVLNFTVPNHECLSSKAKEALTQRSMLGAAD
jgi:hypothetical protein